MKKFLGEIKEKQSLFTISLKLVNFDFFESWKNLIILLKLSESFQILEPDSDWLKPG